MGGTPLSPGKKVEVEIIAAAEAAGPTWWIPWAEEEDPQDPIRPRRPPTQFNNGENGSNASTPGVSNILENSPLNAALQIVDKKVRNLEKRKVIINNNNVISIIDADWK